MSALHWLAVTALMTGVLWIPYIIERSMSLGVMGALGPVGPDELARQAAWAQRARAAHYNAVENLVVFATLVLVAQGLDLADTPQVTLAAQLYFVSRLIHYPVAAAGVPVVRTLAFLGGFVGQILVLLTIFGTTMVA